MCCFCHMLFRDASLPQGDWHLLRPQEPRRARHVGRWHQDFQILDHLKALGHLTYTLYPETKLLTYRITDWVMECTGEECMDGAV